MAIKSNPVTTTIQIDLDMLDSIAVALRKLDLCKNMCVDTKKLRLSSTPTGIGSAVSLIVPVKIVEGDGEAPQFFDAQVVFDITDYSKW